MSRSSRRPEHRGLRRYLLDDERIVIAMHQHWGKVAEPVATTLATLVPVVWLDTAMPLHARVVANLAWWAWFAVVGRMTWRLLQWRHDWFVATDRRLILTYGMLTHKVAMMPLMKVTDMSYSRSPMGRLLGYGRFLMESAGQEQALRKVNWVPPPTGRTGRSAPRCSAAATRPRTTRSSTRPVGISPPCPVRTTRGPCRSGHRMSGTRASAAPTPGRSGCSPGAAAEGGSRGPSRRPLLSRRRR